MERKQIRKALFLVSIVSVVMVCVGTGCGKKESQTPKAHINEKQFFKVKPQDTTPKGKGYGSWQ